MENKFGGAGDYLEASTRAVIAQTSSGVPWAYRQHRSSRDLSVACKVDSMKKKTEGRR